MPKQIKISDELYERLRDIGDGKSMTQTISDLIDGDTVNNVDNSARMEDTADLYQFLVDNFNRLEEKIDSLGGRLEKKESEILVGGAASVSEEVRNTSKADEIQELLAKRRSVVDSLNEKNLVSWVQKKAVEEFWSDEQAKYEGDLHRQELESERDLITEQLHALGV